MLQAHLLDVGKKQYGDCVLLTLGDRTVLIDGGNPESFNASHPHDSIPQQLKQLIGGDPPYHVSLLVVTHAHNDHIGCLPKLIDQELLTADWALVADPDLGWGNPIDGDAIDAGQPPEVQTMLAALREEPMIDASDEDVASFLLDAQTLRTRYIQMLDALEGAGSKVVRYRGGSEADALVKEFADIGMQLLGPNQLILLRCANRIEQLGRDFMDSATDAIAQDASLNEVDLYRRLVVSSDIAGIDAEGIGAALNCMSIVLLFEVDGVKLLMSGDMQFVDPGIPGENSIDAPMAELRQKIAAEAPYDLYKIGHHGSHNSFDQSILDELDGTINFAISTGRNSANHPAPSVLQLLKSKVDEIFWVRTDKNGKCSFDFEDDPPSVEIDRGSVTDWKKNHVDFVTGQTRPQTSQPPAPARPEHHRVPAPPTKKPVPQLTRDDVEVVARVPHRRTKVTITIDVEPSDDDEDGPEPGPAGRELGPIGVTQTLAFVIDRERLAANIGRQATDSIVAGLQQSGQLLIDVAGHNDDSQAAAQKVRQALRQDSPPDGVVVLGGYDVVPSAVIDVLPDELRAQLGHGTGDPDDFIVWSDDSYGDFDDDGVPELPVSRIPDGQSASLVQTALKTRPPTKATTRQGVRNVKRPFADGIFDILTGSGQMVASHPAIHTMVPHLTHDYVYLMLHGDYTNATEFHGEGTQGGRPAVRIENIPDVSSSIVFCGCCWGGLIVDKPAVRAADEVVTARTAADSIPMKFLAAGASAFIGCTGVHYSPIQSPYGFFGGPMHEAFWRQVVAGNPPARALFNAKKAYIAGMFHGRDDLVEQAIEYKILRQFTCLGLGW
jgi:beta-lactamase superfamily II metal-dependent hydrolase